MEKDPPMNKGARDPSPASSSHAIYALLAPIYDQWQALAGATPFWELALDKLEPVLRRGRDAPVVRSFVDLGCGTGELLLALHVRHPDWRLAGIDASEAMLAEARNKPGAAAVSWWAGDLTRLDDVVRNARTAAGPPNVGLTFDAAGAFYDTINHLLDRSALEKTFAGVAGRLLAPGGLFIFDVTNVRGFAAWWKGNLTWRGDGWQVESEMSFQPETAPGAYEGTAQAEVTVTHHGKIARAALTQRCFSDETIRAALQAAGLRVESTHPWSPFVSDANGKTLWIASK
jgi:SAM-dependent methyltransferase